MIHKVSQKNKEKYVIKHVQRAVNRYNAGNPLSLALALLNLEFAKENLDDNANAMSWRIERIWFEIVVRLGTMKNCYKCGAELKDTPKKDFRDLPK